MPYDEILAEMPKVTDNQQESIYLPLADYENAGLVKPSKDYFKVLPDGTLIPLVEYGSDAIIQEVKTVQLYDNGNYIINPDEGYGAIAKVLLEINVPTLDTSDATIVAGDILEGKFGYANGKRVYGNIKNKGNESVILDVDNTQVALNGYYKGGYVKITVQNSDPITPNRETQFIEAEDGKVLGKVTVNPIPDDYIVPTKTLNITANGNYPDIREYKDAIINVPSDIPEGYYKPEGTITFTKNTTEPVSISDKAYAIVDVQLPKYNGSVDILDDELEISGKWGFDDTKFVYTGIERSAAINFQLLDPYDEGDRFDTMAWSAGNLIYSRDGVQYIVFDYGAYMHGEIGWKYDIGIIGALKEVDFGSTPQKVSKEFYEWFIGVTERIVETNSDGSA